jgi:hypothetical protein
VGWESRERGGRYYTRSRKVEGRVLREYVGGGPVGRLAARLDELERERRRVESAKAQLERAHIEAIAAPVVELDEVAGTLCRAALVADGYRNHQGKWRRMREPRT